MVAVAEMDILSRIIGSDAAGMNEDLARYIIDLDYPPMDKKRYEELAYRAQDSGGLSDAEREELESYVRVDDLLAILRAKAMKVLGEPLPNIA